jgi:pimeloyl-ACP methyl ester carboxylesterase
MPIVPTDEFISAHGLRMHVRRWPPMEPVAEGPPLLLIHGLASAARIWDLVAPLLAECGYEVVALDQRGHGESDKPDVGYDFATIVADDASAATALGLVRPVVVGHSWGANVALQYASTFLEQVYALVLIEGATNQLSLRPNWSREQAMIDLAPPRFAGISREAFLSFYRTGSLGRQWSPQLEDIVLNIVQLRADGTVAPRLSFENHLQVVGALWDQPTFALYQQVHCPITLIVAEQNTVPPGREEFVRMRREGIEHIQSLNPRVQVVVMPDTIHDIPLQRPHRLAEEIIRAISTA